MTGEGREPPPRSPGVPESFRTGSTTVRVVSRGQRWWSRPNVFEPVLRQQYFWNLEGCWLHFS